jgi:translocation and assembly module TamB
MSNVRVKQGIAYFSVALLLILLLATIVVYYLAYTHDGSRRLLAMAQRMVPGDLQIEVIHGPVAGPLELKGLVYRQGDGLELRSDRIYLDWRPSRLLGLNLDIIELSLAGTRLALPRDDQGAAPPDGKPFQGLKLPLRVILSRFSSDGFEFVQGEKGDPVRIEKLELSASADEERVSIEQLEAEAFSSRLAVQGSLGLQARLPVTVDLSWSHALEGGPGLAGEGRLSGDLRQLNLEQRLAAPVEGSLQAQLSDIQENPEWRAELMLEQGELGEFFAGFPARLKGRLSAGGSFKNVDLEARLQLAEPRLGDLNGEIQAEYSQGTIHVAKLHLGNAAGLDLNALGSFDPRNGELMADMNWRGLRWPLTAEIPEIGSEMGSLNLQGGLDSYRYRLAMQAFRPEVGPLQLDAAGSGTLQRIGIDTLTMVLQQGRLDGGGELAWSPALSWRMDLKGSGVNPAFVNPRFPGDLGFELDTRGEVDERGVDALFRIGRLSGSLRDYAVEGKGELALKQGEFSVHRVELVTGGNRIEVDGVMGDRLAMHWSVDAPELAALWPGLSGRLRAKGEVEGTLRLPGLSATIDAEELGFEAYRIARLKGEIELETAAEQKLSLTLQSKELSGLGKRWDSLDIDLQGRIPEHRLRVDLAGRETPRLSLMGVAGLHEGDRWQGELQRLKLSAPETGEWQLESPMAYRVEAADYQFAPFCLVSGEARICGSIDSLTDAWKGRLQATRLPLSLLQSLLPDATRITGEADLEAEFNSDANGAIVGKAQLQIPRGGLDFPLGDAQERVDFSASQASAVLDRQGLRAEMTLPLQRLGGFDLKLALPGIDPSDPKFEEQPLEGRIKGGIEDLAMLSAISPHMQNSRGKLSIDMSLQGSLGEPRIKGDAMLDRGAVDIPVLGIELRDIDLRMRTPDLETLSLEGSVRSGEGRLRLQGSTRMDAGSGFPSSYKIEGEDWLAVNVPEAEVRISPGLSFDRDAGKSLLQGEIHLPYARIRPRTLPESAVSGSEDLVIVGDEAAERAQPDSALHAKIRLSLGKRVSFDGFGLRGRFNGDLLIIDEPGRPVVGRGRLGIADGVYQAYGQDLKIDRGYALFADTPVDNPGLDVRAAREIGDITAGLRISGTMKDPKLKLFSTPAMSETDVISYIVTGRPSGEASGKTAGALAVIQASGASTAASEIGRQLGLEELRVETGSTLEEAALVAGTYLSPRLYVQYVNELASGETKVRMRYDLTDRWQMEAETGSTQSGDFFYTFDR